MDISAIIRRIVVAAVLSAFLALGISASSCRPEKVAGYYSGYTCELTETGVGSIPENSTALRLLSTESTRGVSRGHNLTLPRLPVLQVLEYDVTGGQDVLPERPFVQLPRLDILQLLHRASTKDDFRFVLRAGIFEGLNSLRRLILSDLGLGDLPIGALDGLDNLRILELNNNRLLQIPAGTFAPCRNLGILILSRNRIADLRLVSRQGLSELRTLDLSGNKLTALNEEDFSGLENIVSVDLSNNAIQRIDERVWQGLSKLEDIHLNGNILNFSQEISTLDHNNQGNCRGPFCESTSVQTLNTTNSVSCLPPFTGELVSLKKLHLSGNNIDSLLSEHFACLGRLEELDLSRNHMRTLSKAFRSVFNRLEYIDLSSNPWHCDCDMYWVAKWLTSTADNANNLEGTKCATPVRNQILTESFVNRSTECGGDDEETDEYWVKRQTTSDHETTDSIQLVDGNTAGYNSPSDDDHISTAESTHEPHVTSEKDPPSEDNIVGSTPAPTLHSVTEDIRTLDAELVTEIANLEQMKTCDLLLSSVKDTMKTLDSLLQRTTANIDTLNRLLLTTIDNVEQAAARDRTSTESSVAIGHQRNSISLGSYRPNVVLLLSMLLTVCGFVQLFGFK